MKNPWYIAGLHFECQGCGSCCSGPEEGYIWANRSEIELIAEFLNISLGKLREKYLKRFGLRTSIIECPVTKDCIFLQKVSGKKTCMIYSVRPNQCRTWPFWASNLKTANDWNKAQGKCPGINRGKLFSVAEIEKIKNGLPQ